MSVPYDEVYSRETLVGFYVKTNRHYLSMPTAKYEILRIEYDKIHAEVHTSHSFDVTDYFSTNECRQLDDRVPYALASSMIFESKQKARKAVIEWLQKDIKESMEHLHELETELLRHMKDKN